MIILRKGRPDHFYYEEAGGDRVNDKKILEYLAGLRIPPAYHDVEIFYVKAPKILFQGLDDAGRLQQIYSARHCKQACKKKFENLVDFGHALPKIYSDCEKYMQATRITQNKIIAIIIKVISLCYFRIGNVKYVRLYDHHGISTIHKKHVKRVARGIKISFVGKKGVVNECLIEDPKIIRAITTLLVGKRENDHLFTYNEDGQTKLITAIEINNWLGTYGKGFTTKYFRNFDANILLIEFLRQEQGGSAEPTPAQRKKILVAGIRSASQSINNTPAICKKAYISPDLIQLYLEHPRKFRSTFLRTGSARIAFINFLRDL